MKEEIIARVFQNKTNYQFTLQLRARSLSTELKKLFNNPSVVGLKLQVVEVYDKNNMPKYKKTKEEIRQTHLKTMKRYRDMKKLKEKKK